MKIKYYIKLHSGVEESGVAQDSSVENFKANFRMFYGDFLLNLDAEEVMEEVVEPNKNTLIKVGVRLMDESNVIDKRWMFDNDSKNYWHEMSQTNWLKRSQVFKAIEASL